MFNHHYIQFIFLIIDFIYLYRETNTNVNNLKSAQVQEAVEVKPVKKDFYFYQGKFLQINVIFYN